MPAITPIKPLTVATDEAIKLCGSHKLFRQLLEERLLVPVAVSKGERSAARYLKEDIAEALRALRSRNAAVTTASTTGGAS